MEDNEVKARNLSTALALFPLTLLIFLLGLSVFLFGSDSSYGANQIALVMATFAAAIVVGCDVLSTSARACRRRRAPAREGHEDRREARGREQPHAKSRVAVDWMSG